MHQTQSSEEFRDALTKTEVLVDSGINGLYQRSGLFERLIRGIERVASAAGADQDAARLYFPPIMPRSAFAHTGYLKSFPNLTGSIDTFVGDDRDHARLLALAESGGDWTQALVPAEVVMCSAACHSLYPSLTGTMPREGRRFEVQGYCFRHEPSLDPTRMQSFRMHEFVRVGNAEQALEHRTLWLRRGLSLLAGLGLQVEAVVANDPFFGRAGRILANNQRDTELKYEIVAPVVAEKPTAIASANYHQDHFAEPFEIALADGSTAHSACFGFGLERIALALLSAHGLDPRDWPESVQEQVWV